MTARGPEAGLGVRCEAASARTRSGPMPSLSSPLLMLPSPPLQGYNKRATVLYLLRRHSDSITDCRATLKLNPWHFGAASGEGLCHLALGQREAAMEVFERALAIHPGLGQVKQYVAAMRRAEGPGSGGGDKSAGGSA